MAMGTPGYMAPEQYTDAGSVTPTADIYALAIILCELLTGSRPWDAPNPSMLFHMQQTQPPNIAHVEMPAAWRPILLAALGADPRARPQTVYAFLASLASELHGDDRLGVQSGAQMLASFARSLLNQAPPDGETVRARGQVPLMWSPPALTPAPMPNLQPSASPLQTPAIAAPATANERPAVRSAPISTIGGSSGVIAPREPEARSRHARLVGIALGVVAVATLAAFGIGSVLRSQRAEVTPAADPAERNDRDDGTSNGRTSVPITVDAATEMVVVDAAVLPAPIDAASADASIVPPDAASTPRPKLRDVGPSSIRPRTKAPDAATAGSGKKFDPDDVEE
jgi:hypothetical protein